MRDTGNGPRNSEPLSSDDDVTYRDPYSQHWVSSVALGFEPENRQRRPRAIDHDLSVTAAKRPCDVETYLNADRIFRQI
ncbi:hypothetical protein TNCV_4624091 [Trichonephila clavipes]|nr:hypothetical protein TNCV_4624091 [Trichonephila clavipes]